jgi:hypothetical protein
MKYPSAILKRCIACGHGGFRSAVALRLSLSSISLDHYVSSMKVRVVALAGASGVKLQSIDSLPKCHICLH